MNRLLVALAGFAAAALGITALLYAFAAGFRPDVATRPLPPQPAQLTAVERARREASQLDLQHPPVLTRNVNYSEGARAAWWPRNEAPVLAELVREGRLPP